MLEIPPEPEVLAALVQEALAPPPDYTAARQIAAHARNAQRVELLSEIEQAEGAPAPADKPEQADSAPAPAHTQPPERTPERTPVPVQEQPTARLQK